MTNKNNKMSVIKVLKAQPVGDQVIPDTLIHIAAADTETAVALNVAELDAVADFYDKQADLVHTALRRLPGGVYDRVMLRMLESNISLLKVSHDRNEHRKG